MSIWISDEEFDEATPLEIPAEPEAPDDPPADDEGSE